MWPTELPRPGVVCDSPSAGWRTPRRRPGPRARYRCQPSCGRVRPAGPARAAAERPGQCARPTAVLAVRAQGRRVGPLAAVRPRRQGAVRGPAAGRACAQVAGQERRQRALRAPVAVRSPVQPMARAVAERAGDQPAWPRAAVRRRGFRTAPTNDGASPTIRERSSPVRLGVFRPWSRDHPRVAGAQRGMSGLRIRFRTIP